MIYVSQGHEKGIGLEVFIKSLSMAPATWINNIHLVGSQKTCIKQFKKLNIDADFGSDHIEFSFGKLKSSWISSSKLPESTVAIEEALGLVDNNSKNILFTLPTTKDSLVNPKKPKEFFLGHTEYLRAKYKDPTLGMFFSSTSLNTLLLTDHIALKDIPKIMTSAFLKKKLSNNLDSLSKLEPQLKNAYVSGLNPHAGENGLLGKEELKLQKALESIKPKSLKLHGLFPGDTLHVQRKSSSDLLVYLYHDQGLSSFKSLMGTLGANITLGLKFVRLSVDHGTAFNLYGKNIADYRGAYFCLAKAMAYQEQLDGKNSNFKGKSSQSQVN
jgi:4-hydroxy-L-threonine phosphate dehydrogenase PdxA